MTLPISGSYPIRKKLMKNKDYYLYLLIEISCQILTGKRKIKSKLNHFNHGNH